MVVVDCLSAIQLLQRSGPPDQLFRQLPAFPQCCERLQSHGVAVALQWILLRGKYPEWKPELGEEDVLRALNERADAAATNLLLWELQHLQPWAGTVREATRWSAEALAWAKHAAVKIDQHVTPGGAHTD